MKLSEISTFMAFSMNYMKVAIGNPNLARRHQLCEAKRSFRANEHQVFYWADKRILKELENHTTGVALFHNYQFRPCPSGCA